MLSKKSRMLEITFNRKFLVRVPDFIRKVRLSCRFVVREIRPAILLISPDLILLTGGLGDLPIRQADKGLVDFGNDSVTLPLKLYELFIVFLLGELRFSTTKTVSVAITIQTICVFTAATLAA